MRLINLNFIIKAFYQFFFSHPTPVNLSYFWNFGVYSLVCLVIQIITGIFLAMNYAADQNIAFLSIEHLMRDINLGWLIRYIHSNGASMFFIVVYIHTFRGLYYSSYSYPRELLWVIGVVIILIMILTAFLGYVLPRGQMSFWAATVITNLVSAIPIIGTKIVIWLWGGYAVDNATLTRFFSLHYLFPFILLALVGIHLIYLHKTGSNNPIGIEAQEIDITTMYPYYIYKDLYGLILFLIIFSYFIFFIPNYLGHTDNYIMANPLVTPNHIVPEWYFSPFYAILRSIPDKLFGVIAMFFSIIILALLPYILKIEVKALTFRPMSRFFFGVFISNCLLLGWLGSQPASEPYVLISQILTFLYFSNLIIIYPLIIKLEKFLAKHD